MLQLNQPVPGKPKLSNFNLLFLLLTRTARGFKCAGALALSIFQADPVYGVGAMPAARKKEDF